MQLRGPVIVNGPVRVHWREELTPSLTDLQRSCFKPNTEYVRILYVKESDSDALKCAYFFLRDKTHFVGVRLEQPRFGDCSSKLVD